MRNPLRYDTSKAVLNKIYKNRQKLLDNFDFHVNKAAGIATCYTY